jgi:hypothetical protein
MPAPTPRVRDVSFLKTKIMQPALTSNFECHFVIPPEVNKQLGYNGISGSSPFTTETLTISCSDASLPGSSLTTHELNNDFTGVTQRHAYRRLYDDRADFTFYVNRDYLQIRLFEIWMRYIAGEQASFGESNTVSYRVNYPKNYKASAIYITKFERDLGSKSSPNNKTLVYTFVNAFPISITSIPVSYDSSQLLKCTVSFTYDRYFVGNVKDKSPTGDPSQSLATGVPNPNDVTYSSGVDQNAFTGDASLTKDVTNTLNNVSPNQLNRQPAFTQSEITSAIDAERQLQLNGVPADSGALNLF